ncbi:DUF6000 family protein [Flavobacterium silvaticum]|uniref:Uncharacterized protein n=1 Tax=Flavobacterium silvaticum TaxID=1852020 RepID=A0A972FIN2_9FLAO|nr:DUF6000 family protein [Flavobacterium silvaticum]NMH26463.1 hypothetical protein [Flavobacterium silvaticum]
MEELERRIKMHSAGATVINTAFQELPSFQNNFDLDKSFIQNWVLPYYMKIGVTDSELQSELVSKIPQMSKDILASLLGDFDWRTRQTGAYFAAIKNDIEFIDIIGVHFLKSEVSYAGQIYAIALAYFNTEKSVQYIDKYLEYYLSKPDLWFDQGDAMAALKYLDHVNKTNHLAKHLNDWENFLTNKPYWKKEIEFEHMKNQIEFIQKLQAV